VKRFWHSFGTVGAKMDVFGGRSRRGTVLLSESFWSHPPGLNRRPADYEADNPTVSCSVFVVICRVSTLSRVLLGGFWMGNWMGKKFSVAQASLCLSQNQIHERHRLAPLPESRFSRMLELWKCLSRPSRKRS